MTEITELEIKQLEVKAKAEGVYDLLKKVSLSTLVWLNKNPMDSKELKIFLLGYKQGSKFPIKEIETKSGW